MPDPARPAGVVVASHVCLDIIPQLLGPADVAPGRLLNIGPAAISTGGAVANTGIALHRLGVPVRLMGKVGDDVLGRAVLDVLRAAGPRLANGMIVAPGEATSYSIVISPPGVDRSFLHCPGSNDTFGAEDVRDEQFDGARLLHFGYPPIMRRMRAGDGEQLCQLFRRARDAGLAISLDMCQPDPASEAGATDWPAFCPTSCRTWTCFYRASTSCCSCWTGPHPRGRPAGRRRPRSRTCRCCGGSRIG